MSVSPTPGSPRATPAASARQPLTGADVLSLVRVPLGAAFLLTARHLGISLLILVLAGISDVLDGWWARRSRPPGAPWEPHRGDWLDPVCDKIFLLLVMIGLWSALRPPLWALGLIVSRDVGQLLGALVRLLVPAFRRKSYAFRANWLGKATTVAQFAAGLALLLRSPLSGPLAVAAGGLGLVALAVYVRRFFAPEM